MPTFTFHEHFDNRPASASVRSGRKVVRRWEVICSDIVDGVAVIEAMATEMTGESVYFGVPHPTYANCFCSDINADSDGEDYYTWMVQADYEEPPALPGFVPGMPNGGTVGGRPGSGGSGTPYQPPAPWDRPTYFSIDYRKEPRYLRKDVDGKPLVNTAKDALEDVPPIYFPIGILKATKFYQTWSFDLGLSLIGRTNQDTWQGYDPDTFLIEACPAKPVSQNGWSYWQVDYVLAYNEDGWNPTKILNMGRRTSRLVAPQAPAPQFRQFTTIADGVGVLAGGLAFLNLAGDAVLVLEPGVEPVELEFRFHKRINFNGLIDP